MKAVLFDLDGTLLPMDQEVFVESYMGQLAGYMAQYDYEPKRLVKTVWEGTGAMMRNDTGRRNEEVFWERFRKEYGPRTDTDKPLFEEFYATGFGKVRTSCGFNPASGELIAWLKEQGIRLILATNPLFPRVATVQRIRWAGLDPADFEIVTTYESSRFCKPDPRYYQDILTLAGLAPEDCVMVGNDAREDMAAEKLGMKVFLLTDCLLHGEGKDLSRWPRGGFGELKEFLWKNME